MADHDGAPALVTVSGEETVSKPRPKPPSRKGCTPANAWPKGVSGNPGGRPRRAYAACEAVREMVDPREWIEAELAVARDTEKPWDVRRDAWRALIDRGFVRPPTGIEVSSGMADEPTFDHLSLERRRELLAELEGAPSTDEQVSIKPSLSDDESVKLG